MHNNNVCKKCKIKLISNDNIEIDFPIKYIKYSNLLKSVFDDDDDEYDNKLNLQLNSYTILKIIDFFDLLSNNNNKIYKNNNKNINYIYECFKKYIDISMINLHNLSNAANYLYSEELLILCVKKIASKLNGLSLMEIKELNVENNFTKDEEIKISLKKFK